MDRLRTIEVFIHVAEAGGFAPAARRLGMSPPAVTRAVASLEERLGTQLLRRTTRSVRLTESGRRFLDDGKRILGELAEAEDAAVGLHVEPAGNLRITAPALFGTHHVMPILCDFLDSYPKVTADTLFVDRVVDMLEEGQDVAIRIGHLPDSSLIATRVGVVRRVVFSSPEYIRENGTPRHPSELEGLRIIHSLPMAVAPEWRFNMQDGEFSIRLNPRMRTNSNDAVVRTVLNGWGISRLLSYQIAPYLADGRLVPILEEFEPPPLPIHVVHQEGRLVSSRVRAFIDFLVARLRAETGFAG